MERDRRSPELSQDQQLDAALELLERGVSELLVSERFAEYLRAVGSFHHYSFSNILLIVSQQPHATQVAGYRAWRALGRQVRSGEHGIKVIVPRVRKVVDEQTGENIERLTGFGLGTVFDVSQTEGQPLPAPPLAQELRNSSEPGRSLYGATRNFLNKQGVVVMKTRLEAEKGRYYPARKLILVGQELAGDQAAKTLLHEAAHFVSEHGQAAVRREDAETVAESAAFVVASHFGVETGDYSFPYVAAWARDREALARNLSAIQKTSHQLIRGIEGTTAEDGR